MNGVTGPLCQQPVEDRGTKRRPSGPPEEREVIQKCQAMMEKMAALLPSVHEKYSEVNSKLGRMEHRMGAVEAKLAQMYSYFLKANPEATPIIEEEFVEMVDERILKIFFGLFFSPRECHILKSNAEFKERLAKEFGRIGLQGGKEQLKGTFDKMVQLCKNEENCRDILCRTLGNLDIGAATIDSSIHAPEDRFHKFELDITTPKGPSRAKFFAILDGHGGDEAAKFCEKNLQPVIDLCMKTFNAEGLDYQISNALKMAFVRLDSMYKADYEREFSDPRVRQRKFPGTTLCLAMFLDDFLYVANTGDSRAVLNGGDLQEAMQLSYDFKASDTYSTRATVKRGGTVSTATDGFFRVNGILCTTRAIGDEKLRNPGMEKAITPRPKVVRVDLNQVVKDRDSGYLIIGSDGLFDASSSVQVGVAACQLAKEKMSPKEIARILTSAARKCGSKDDITAWVISLKNAF